MKTVEFCRAMLVFAVLSMVTGCGSFRNKLARDFANISDRPCTVSILGPDNTISKTYETDGYVHLDQGTRVFTFRVKGKMVRVMGNAIVEER